MDLFILSVSGGLGAIVRYLVGNIIMEKYPDPPIPMAMLSVNILGALGLGLFYGAYFRYIPMDAYDNLWFLALGIGFFGAFTTFSTFSMEALELFRKKSYQRLVWYVAISLLGSIVMFSVGYGLGLWI
ncbi:fluoride efflux transporter CrcB [Salicibibacter cibarius]|uniref:Fluoride-specific ion channel FluC n=1 Tax=Salicibibacter cibarius TaxID=2743000 RepID=A0A7T7CCG3_9BACI|nr:fluoride efflux transporter CrcB [Salicibibacter cibarius]QQK76964.1 fluoride efflux transporter CrcB [Salicibibacter cibarius]